MDCGILNKKNENKSVLVGESVGIRLMSLAMSCDGLMSPWGGSVCAVVSGHGDGALCYDVCEIDHEVLW